MSTGAESAGITEKYAIEKDVHAAQTYQANHPNTKVINSDIHEISSSYTIGEEIANSVLHGIGALAAIAGLVLLNLKNSGVLGGYRANDIDIVAAIIFTATMFGMFLISTLYHAIQRQSVKQIFRKLDHSVIFIFIAGTYTPICLSGLRGAWGWSLFFFFLGLALTGVILNILGF
jgi:hemolysin III